MLGLYTYLILLYLLFQVENFYNCDCVNHYKEFSVLLIPM